MKTRSVFIALGGTLLLIAALAAQQRNPGMPMQNMSMQDMMKICREHCQATATSIDQLSTKADEAEKSNDPKRMRAALGDVRKALGEMKNHTNMCMSMMSMMGNMMGRPEAQAAQQGQRVQTARIAVTEKGFEPAALTLKPNVPARVTFVRQTNQTCATSVAIPEYKINRELPLNQPVVVEFTPTKTGEFAFACGMNMLKGKLLVQESK
jgi:plastocyanin